MKSAIPNDQPISVYTLTNNNTMKRILFQGWRIVASIGLCSVLGMLLAFDVLEHKVASTHRDYPLVGQWQAWVPEPWDDSTYFSVEVTPMGDSCVIKFGAIALAGKRVHTASERPEDNTVLALTTLKGKSVLSFKGQFPYGGRGEVVIWLINDSTLGWKSDETTLTPQPTTDNFIPARAVLKRIK